ncbi:putative cytochrome P450 [Ilyonectria destructans]|nr:putative cytochrome P450 [Ilyonectria destructans]
MTLLKQLPGLSLVQCSVLFVALYFVYSKLIYPFLLSPVRHIPGPWYARISRMPLQWATLQRGRAAYATRLLDKYGPVVVIAPDQVHTTDDSAMKIIYDRSSNKTGFYKSMGSWKGVTSTLGFVDYRTAAPSRNNLLQCFQNRNLSILVENLESHIDEFIQLLNKSVEKDSTVDGVVVFRLLALDIVTDVLWGETDTLLANRSAESEETPVFLRRFHAFSTWNALKSFIPALDVLVKTCGSRSWKQLRNDCNAMDITARDALQRWKSSGNEKSREKDVLSMLQSMNSASAPAVPTEDIPAYMVEMLAAGSSTTSHTAAFACWLLTRHPEVQDRLRKELFEQYPNHDNIDIQKTMNLPYLDGVIRETMRLYPMIPGPLERYLGKDIVVNGKRVPKGVIASTAAYNQARLEEVFPQSSSWIPDRWIEADERMRLNWTPFGHGCRSCPGSNLAMTELKYMIGKIFRLFRVVTPPGYEQDTLELADVFAAGSKTGHVWLKFVEAKNEI